MWRLHARYMDVAETTLPCRSDLITHSYYPTLCHCRLKTYLRATIKQERLNHISVHQNKSDSIDVQKWKRFLKIKWGIKCLVWNESVTIRIQKGMLTVRSLLCITYFLHTVSMFMCWHASIGILSILWRLSRFYREIIIRHIGLYM